MNVLIIGKFYPEGVALHIACGNSLANGRAARRFEPGFRSGRIGGRFWHWLDQVQGMKIERANQV